MYIDIQDYEDVLGELHAKLKSEYTSCPGPREQIFAKNNEKSEKMDSHLNRKGSHSRDFVVPNKTRSACLSRSEQTKELRRKSQSNKFTIPDEEDVHDAAEVRRNSCSYEVKDVEEDEEDEDQQDVRRNSCSYEIK